MENWIEKIKEGMKLIQEGCAENKSWLTCEDCPFDKFCDDIMKRNDGNAPSELF